MFTPPQHWLNHIKAAKDKKEPHIEIYEEWSKILEGTLISGKHLHLYRNNVTGLLDYSVEEVKSND